MANTYLKLFSPNGVLRKIINDFTNLTYTRKVNDVGSMSVTLPANRYPLELFPDDCRFEIWRKPNGTATRIETNRPYLEMSTQWFKYGQVKELNDGGEKLIKLQAFDACELLKRRIVAYFSGSDGASKTATADNMLKAIVRENLGANANDFNTSLENRIMPDFEVQPDLSLSVSITKSFSWREVFQTLQEIASSSDLEGIYLAFDVVWQFGQFEFRSYKGQRGIDRRMSLGQRPNLFSPNLGNLTNLALVEDTSETFNFVYTGGQGQGENRTIISAYDPTRKNNAPYARREEFRDARQSSDTDKVENEAVAALRDSRIKRILSATFVETPRMRYGVDWFWGDYFTVEFEKKWYNTRLETLSISVSTGSENVTPRFETNIGDYLVETYEPAAPDPPATLLCPPSGTIYSAPEGVTYSFFSDGARILSAWRGDLTHNLSTSGSGSIAFGLNFTEPYGRGFYVTSLTVNLSYSTTQDGSNYWEVLTANENTNQTTVGVGHTQANPASLTKTNYGFDNGNNNHLRFTPIGSPGTLTVSASITYYRFLGCQYDT